MFAPGAAPMPAFLHQPVTGIRDDATHQSRRYRSEMPLEMFRHFARQHRTILTVERLEGDVRRHIVEQAPAQGQLVLFVTVDRQQVPVDIKVRHALLIILSLGTISAARNATSFVLIIYDHVHLE